MSHTHDRGYSPSPLSMISRASALPLKISRGAVVALVRELGVVTVGGLSGARRDLSLDGPESGICNLRWVLEEAEFREVALARKVGWAVVRSCGPGLLEFAPLVLARLRSRRRRLAAPLVHTPHAGGLAHRRRPCVPVYMVDPEARRTRRHRRGGRPTLRPCTGIGAPPREPQSVPAALQPPRCDT